MTITLTREQMKILSPKVKKEIAFENKWRTKHSVSLFVRDHKKANWCRLSTQTYATEREHQKVLITIENQQLVWRMNYPQFAGAQFKIVDGEKFID